MSRLKTLFGVVFLAAAASSCSSHSGGTGSLHIPNTAFHGGSDANLTFVKPEREGPMVRVFADESPGGHGWLISVAIRNFGHEKSAPDVEVQVQVDGKIVADWMVAQSIDSDEVVANPSLRIGDFPPGEHELRVTIDPSNRIPETMKTDNEFRATFTVPPKG